MEEEGKNPQGGGETKRPKLEKRKPKIGSAATRGNAENE